MTLFQCNTLRLTLSEFAYDQLRRLFFVHFSLCRKVTRALRLDLGLIGKVLQCSPNASIIRSSLAVLFDCKKVSVVVVAQLVESRIVIPVVVGSSPIDHPKEFV